MEEGDAAAAAAAPTAPAAIEPVPISTFVNDDGSSKDTAHYLLKICIF